MKGSPVIRSDRQESTNFLGNSPLKTFMNSNKNLLFIDYISNQGRLIRFVYVIEIDILIKWLSFANDYWLDVIKLIVHYGAHIVNIVFIFPITSHIAILVLFILVNNFPRWRDWDWKGIWMIINMPFLWRRFFIDNVLVKFDLRGIVFKVMGEKFA